MGKRGRPRHPDILTPREWEVLELLREGLTNPEIAQRLALSRDTVKTHVSEILSKLGVATREEAAAWQPEPVLAGVEPVRRPWWAAGFAWLRPLTLAKVAGAAVVVATVAALGVLAWGVWRTNGGEDGPPIVQEPSPTATAAPPTPLPVVSIVDPETRWIPGVYIISLTTGEATRLPAQVNPRATFGWPVGFYAVSPTDSRIAVVNLKLSPDSVSRLTIYDSLGGYLTQVSLDPLVSVEGLSWSPKGDRLVATGSGRLLLLDPDTGQRSVLFGEPGDEMSPWGPVDWSPDGERLVVQLGTGGNEMDLATVDLGGTVLSRIGTQYRGGTAVWSPDGSQIAYDDPGGVYLAAADGSSPGKLLTPGASPAWSPDGSRLAFSVRAESGELFVYTIAAGGGDSRRVVQGSAPVWSPDGTKIAVLRDGNAFVVDADGSDEVQVTASPLPFLSGLTWSAHGDQVLAVYEPGVDSEVYVANADGSGTTQLAFGFGARWSPDGSRIAFTSGFGGLGYWGAIYTMRPDGSSIRKLAGVGLSDMIPSCFGGEPFTWSPDGRRIAYHSGQNVYVVETGGASEPVQIGPGFGPVWSPSGDRIAFTAPGESAICGVYTADPSDPTSGKLLFDDARLPAWSPDGSRIAFVRHIYGADQTVSIEIYIGGAGGGKPKRIARLELDPFGDRFIPPPAWSPDGSLIALESEGAVYLLDPGGRADPLRFAIGGSPAWLADGRRLAFTAREEGKRYAYVADVDGQPAPQQITEANNFSWSPDGTRIAFVR